MLLQHFAEQRAALLERIAEYVGFETPSQDKARCDALADRLSERFAPFGPLERFANPHGGDHLRISVAAPGAPSAARPALILCHYDTVWAAGTVAERPFRVEGEVAYGPGAYDMKASLAVAEYALRAAAALDLALARPVTILLTSDEEIGSPTSRALIEATAREAAHVFVLEPPVEPGSLLKTARKGGGMFTVRITGRAAHAGVEPEKGISAISELAHQIMSINALNDAAQGTTLNVGTVEGGTRPNVVPAAAALTIDARAWTQAEADRVQAALLGLKPQLAGAQIQVEGAFRRPPMERSAAGAALFEQAQAIGADLGLQLAEGRTGGGSDGNFTAALGIPTLDGLGTPGQGAHATHEQISLSGLVERAALVTALLTRV